MRINLLLALLITLIFSTNTHASPQIRVALVRGADGIAMTGRNFYCYLPTTPPTERTISPLQAAAIHHTGAGFVVNGKIFVGNQLECMSGEGILVINDIPTQGQVHLLKEGPRKISAVERMPIDQYLIGVVQGEVGANWPVEALKAQAIAARSYATAVMRERKHATFDVAITTRDQVYDSRVKIPASLQAAVLDTQGQILLYQEEPLKAFYHSCCGGSGESLKAVTADLSPGRETPFPPPVKRDPYCRRSPAARWHLELNDNQVVESLKSIAPSIESINQIHFLSAPNGRIETVTLDTQKPVQISGNQFRKALGYEKVKSTWFTVRRSRHSLILSGRGYGHGVGMCQWGARGMAEQGKTALQILNFYYPDALISTPASMQ